MVNNKVGSSEGIKPELFICLCPFAIKKSKNSQVIALASRNLSRATALTKKFKIPKSYGSYKELYEDKDVDIIYNPLPNHLHIKSSIEACKNKKNLLLEKPLSLKSKDIDPLIKIASQNKVIVKEAFMVRHHPQWRWVKEYIKSGKIGSISSISTVFSYNNKNPKNILNVKKFIINTNLKLKDTFYNCDIELNLIFQIKFFEKRECLYQILYFFARA